MRIAITGGLGFIGQNLARYLRQTIPSVELVAVDTMRIENCEKCEPYDRVVSDCFSSDPAKEIYAGVDVLVHLAACTSVRESISSPHRTFDNNVQKTEQLLEFLREYAPKVHFIFASTGGAIIGNHNGPINEEIVARPISPYGASKLAVEGLMSAYSGSYNLRCTSLRFSNVYGAFSYRKNSVVAAFCKSYIDSGTLQINGDGVQTRDYIDVKDICRAAELVIRSETQGVFQLGTGMATSILELVEIFRGLDPERNIEIVKSERLVGEVIHNVADISLIRRSLGFTPQTPLREGVRRTLDWFKEYQQKCLDLDRVFTRVS